MTEQTNDGSSSGTGDRRRVARLRRRFRKAVPFASGILAALLAISLYGWLVPGPHIPTQREVTDSIAQALASVTPAPPVSEGVYQLAQPSLVLIQTRASTAPGKTDGALGSGVVVDDRGDILTSLHVVADAAEIQLTFADGTQSGAQILVRRPENDTAVLRATTPPAKLVPATLGNPNALQIGSEAFVVGNPFGLPGSMSTGVISGLGRSFRPEGGGQELHGLIQIDAAVNPGNSGGPLLNRDGQVVGIVTALLNPTKDDVFIGIGLAVPIDVAAGAAGLPPY
jgi:S1-C subfamily serine protease